MQDKIYVDTNVVIDICDIKRPFHNESLDLIQSYAEGELYINSDSLSTLFYVLYNKAKFSFEEALEKIYFVHDIFSVVAIDETVSLQALKLCRSGVCIDYEDALQYICAKKVNADAIVTNDARFVSSDIKIIRTNRPL